MFAYAEPVTFYEAGTVSDPYSGEDGQDWDNPVPVLSAAAGVEPLASQEPLQDGRQAVIVGYRLYFDHILPPVGNYLSKTDYAYSYLVTSVDAFPSDAAFLAQMAEAGLAECRVTDLTFGLAKIFTGRKL